MKKIFVLLLLFTSTGCIGQETTTPPAMTKSDYLARAKRQNTAAWVTLGGGFAISTVGMIVGNEEVKTDIGNLFRLEDTRKTYAGGILLIAGGVTMLGSIPFFVSATENRKKAADAPLSLKLKMETQPFIRQGSLVKTPYPAISLRIAL
ncbi:MAG: hypothetical protein ACT4OJ_07700 [Bacteroidota bacterium]